GRTMRRRMGSGERLSSFFRTLLCRRARNFPAERDSRSDSPFLLLGEPKPSIQWPHLRRVWHLNGTHPRLPEESYDKELFAEKRDKVFELTLDLAINHLKWAARTQSPKSRIHDPDPFRMKYRGEIGSA